MAVIREAVLNSFKTIQEMFEARELQDIADGLRNISNKEIDEIMRTRSTFVLTLPAQAAIIFYLENKVKVGDVIQLRDSIDAGIDNIIIVLREKTTASNIANITSNSKTQVFEIKDLQFNITKHNLVPKHRVIRSTDEANSILRELNIKSRSQLPVILKSDPMAKFLNARPGDLVEITRYSPTSGEHTFYRITV